MGSAFGRDIVKRLLEHTGVYEPFRNVAEAPAEVELVMREKDGRRFLFCLNYQATAQTVLLRTAATSLYTGERMTGRVTLPPYGTEVFELKD